MRITRLKRDIKPALKGQVVEVLSTSLEDQVLVRLGVFDYNNRSNTAKVFQKWISINDCEEIQVL